MAKGKLSLAITHPEKAKEWHPTLNGDLTPNNVTAGSGKKVWWNCPTHGEYESMIFNRVKNNNGCPYCAGQKIHIHLHLL